MSPQKEARPTRPTTTYAETDTQPSDSPTVDLIDSILDEIDEVLEENAETFVKAYVQKGGE
jgi:ubiquitin-like protein Pup